MEYARTNTMNDAAPAVALNDSELQVLTSILSKAIIRANPCSAEATERLALVGRAERHYAFRRQRERLTGAVFGYGLFADPAWDMMLDLYVQTSRGISVSVTSACIGGTAPPTTALRYLADLEKRGIVQRFTNPTDKRSLHVRMTEEGMELMDRICAQMPDDEASSRSSLARHRSA